MKLYVGDYHGDTTHLTTAEHGAYLLLLMAMWRAGGKLPRDDRRLSALTKLSAGEWSDMKPTIMEFFTVSGGSISHKRLVTEIGKYEAVVEKRAKAGKASAAKKALENNEQASTHVEQVLNTCSHNQNQNQNQNHSLEETSSSKETRAPSKPPPLFDQFDDFWKRYPLKKAKAAAKAAYPKALRKTDHATLVRQLDHQIRCGVWEGGFGPHGATWLNGERWNDECKPRGFAGMAGRPAPGGGGRQDTTFADIADRRQREREQGMAIPGGEASLSGIDLGWADGAIDGEATPGPRQAGGGHDAGYGGSSREVGRPGSGGVGAEERQRRDG
jgi:uncharacterized protein YdaU (DUF1376 family)